MGKKLAKKNGTDKTAKKTVQAITGAKTWPKCNAVKGCGKPSVVMKRINGGKDQRHYCAAHSDMITRKPLIKKGGK